MQVTTSPHSTILRPLSGPPPDPQDPSPDKLDKAVLTGQIIGGLGAGLGLGYLGMDLGLRLGMECGMRAMGTNPLAQVLGIFTVGLARGIVGAGIGGALGAATGIGLGMWLGGKAGGHFSHQS